MRLVDGGPALENWFLPAVLTAFFYGVQSAYLKGVLPDADKQLVAWGIFFFSLPVYLGMLYVGGMPEVSTKFWLAFSVSLGINLIAWPLFVRSIQLSDISLVMPLVAFTPVFILGVEFVVLGAVPQGLGLVGILLIVLGAYVLNVRKGMGGIFEPLTSLARNRGAVLMLIVAALWSISATVEKITVVESSPAFYLTALSVGFALVFSPVVALRVDKPLQKLRGQWVRLAGAGLLTGAMAGFQMHAIQTTPLVNYVVSIKRAGMLVSVIVGWLIFKEKNILFRLIGAALMVAGVALIRMV
jgi:drug/metabolite transporter (DMT)-like permease